MKNPATRGVASEENTTKRLNAAMQHLMDQTPDDRLQWTPGDRRRSLEATLGTMFAEFGLDSETCIEWVRQQTAEDMANMQTRAVMHGRNTAEEIVGASLSVAYTLGFQIGLILGSRTV